MIIYSKYIPFKGYIAMAIFPFIIVRKNLKDLFYNSIENHEKIHFEQQKEMLLIFFFVWYVLEWLIKSFYHLKNAYKLISFEIEANLNEYDLEYIKTRKRFKWLKYV